MSHEPIVFGQPDIRDAEIEDVVAVLRSKWIGTGPRTKAFEREFAAYKAAPHAIAVSSCTAALHLALIASGVGPGDEVITTPLTFCATINAILHTGARPVLADVDRETMNIDVHAVRRALTDRTKVVLPVHFAGRACDMGGLGRIADEYNLEIVEDCAHAIETTWAGKSAGTFGAFGCFSFYATKNLTTGEGGLVLARDEDAAERIRSLAQHGLSRDAWQRFSEVSFAHYFVTDIGYKYNMSDISAAIGLQQLRRIDTAWQRRLEIWQRFERAFAHLPLDRPAPLSPTDRHALHLYTLLVDPAKAGIDRDTFVNRLATQGIGAGIHYLSVAEHPVYQDRMGWKPADCPNAALIGRQTVSLPLSSALSDNAVERIIDAVLKVMASV